MFHIILFEPEIPPNTGNLIRLSANTGCQLHLVKPLGFTLDDKQLKRAGLDYHEYANVLLHENLDDCLKTLNRVFALSSKVSTRYTDIAFEKGDAFLFGPESRGLPENVLKRFSTEEKLTIPQKTNCRSLNLSNSAAIVLYEALRQHSFAFE